MAANAALRPFQTRARSRVGGGKPLLPGLVARTDCADLQHLRVHLRGGPVELDQQQRFAVRVARVHGGFEAKMLMRSIISIAEGSMPAAMMSDTLCAACAVVLKAASSVCTAAGFGTTRRTTCVAMPSVPSEPMKTPARS